MQCTKCGGDGQTKKIVEKYQIPFYCPECGGLKFKYQAMRDIAFVWPERVPEKVGRLYIPDTAKEQLRTEYGVVISIGKGTLDKNKRFYVSTEVKVGDYIVYDINIPWQMLVDGTDGKSYVVKFMGELDIKAKIV